MSSYFLFLSISVANVETRDPGCCQVRTCCLVHIHYNVAGICRLLHIINLPTVLAVYFLSRVRPTIIRLHA